MSHVRIGARLRLSLYARMIVAATVIGSFSLVIGGIVSVLGGLLGLTVLGWLDSILDVVSTAPRLAPHVHLPAVVVAVAAMLGLVAVFVGWPAVSRHTGAEHVVPPRHPISLATLAATVACLYLVVVEGSAAVLAGIPLAPSSPWAGGLFLLSVAVLSVAATAGAFRKEVRKLRERIVAGAVPASEFHPELVAAARRLASLADVPAPEVHLAGSVRPESFTVGAGESATVVVSTGVIDALAEEEIEAVLAHEISHLANGDSRIMGAALVPVLVADELLHEEPETVSEELWNAAVGLVKLYGQFGVAVLSRGREWGADAGAAALTGSPGALASALATLDDAKEPPETDLREWERSVASIDILPPAGDEVGTGPFRTHPRTGDRIDRLEALAARVEER